MSRKQRHTSEWQWEQALIEAYVDHRWHQLLDPLHEQFHRWERGELTHDDLDQAIHQTHKETQRLYGLFTERRERLVRLIQWDLAWFAPWLAAHPPPPMVTLIPRLAEPEDGVDTAAESRGQGHADE